MPRKVVILLCFVAVCLRVPAYSANFMAGVRGGLNLATWYGDDVDNRYKKLKPGLIAGISLQTKARDFIGFMMDIMYSQKGAKWENLGDMLYYRLHYIEVPVMCKLMLPNKTVVKPFTYTGTFIAVTFLSKEYEVEDGKVEDINTISELITRVDFGFTFGGGVDFDFDKIALTLDVRYSLGMITLDGEKNFYDDKLAEIKNGVLSIIGGFSWEN